VRRDARAHPFGHLLLLDDAGQPVGWIRAADIPEDGALTDDMAVPMSPLLNRRATLKDALSLLLDSDVQAGIVVDREGRALGVVTVDMIAEVMRQGDHVVPDEPQGPDDDGAGPIDLAETEETVAIEAETR
jgi:predicted transcriptional regulator